MFYLNSSVIFAFLNGYYKYTIYFHSSVEPQLTEHATGTASAATASDAAADAASSAASSADSYSGYSAVTGYYIYTLLYIAPIWMHILANGLSNDTQIELAKRYLPPEKCPNM